MALHGRRIAILAEQDYEDLELWYPKLRLEEAGATVTVIGPEARVYLSKHGLPVEAEVSATQVRAHDFDGVVVPGGWAPDYLRRHESVTGLVRDLNATGELVAAICHGGSVLVSADVLKDKRVTSVSAIRDDLRNAGAKWSDEAVVVDGNLITSRRPADLPVFMAAILAFLEEGEHAEHGARLAIDGDIVSLRLDPEAYAYMKEMLGRIPAAKGYKGQEFDPASDDVKAILSDFVTLADPRGSLEAEPAVVVGVQESGGYYLASGNARVLSVLEAAGVPGVKRP